MNQKGQHRIGGVGGGVRRILTGIPNATSQEARDCIVFRRQELVIDILARYRAYIAIQNVHRANTYNETIKRYMA
jgi:hypothetical protein